jgi:hypothetical protein
VSVGSSIFASSTQSDGLLALGSGIRLGALKSQSSSSFPLSTFSPSIRTSYVLSELRINV